MPDLDARRNVRLTLEYDGTHFAGWQRQRGQRTVQQVVEEALEQHLGHPVRVTASGRTDAGVHARGQVISFFTESAMPINGIWRGLGSYLPADIAVREATDAPPDFDARRSARLRWYRFFLCNRPIRPAVGASYLTHIPKPVDLTLMQQAAHEFTGEHDFQAFRAITCTATRTRLTMHPIEISALPDNLLQVDIRCRSFLHNMVRIITGTLVAAGQGRLTPAQIREMLDSGVRLHEAVTVPPNGLFLWHVYYEGDEMPLFTGAPAEPRL